MARPSEYTIELAELICERLSEGKTLTEICPARMSAVPVEWGKINFPHISTVFRWLAANAEFRDMYTRAREAQADVWANEIIDIADTCRIGTKTEEREISRQCSACLRDVRWIRRWVHPDDQSALCEGAEALKIVETKTITADMVERSRLQIDARKWAAAKGAPKKYGDRLELAGDKDNPLVVDWASGMREARAKRLAKAKPEPE